MSLDYDKDPTQHKENMQTPHKIDEIVTLLYGFESKGDAMSVQAFGAHISLATPIIGAKAPGRFSPAMQQSTLIKILFFTAIKLVIKFYARFTIILK